MDEKQQTEDLYLCPPPDQMLYIKPKHDLLFQGPFDVVTKAQILLYNSCMHKVIYKIQPEFPEFYKIYPAVGVLYPLEMATIRVYFNALPGGTCSSMLRQRILVKTIRQSDDACSPWPVLNNACDSDVAVTSLELQFMEDPDTEFRRLYDVMETVYEEYSTLLKASMILITIFMLTLITCFLFAIAMRFRQDESLIYCRLMTPKGRSKSHAKKHFPWK